MKIQRHGKAFIVVQNNKTLLENATFDQARLFLAQNGNEDASKPIVKHSLKARGERIQEPCYCGEYELLFEENYILD